VKVKWSENALNDLIRLAEFIERDNPRAAKEFAAKLFRKADILKEQPLCGRKVPEFDDPKLRELIEGNYRLVYKAERNSITILTVFEGRRLFPEIKEK